MLGRKEIIETIDMVEKEHFDVRTVTMGISLLSCIRESAEETARLCYDKICKKAENIVKVANEISDTYGVPIINKRVSITPASLLTAPFAGKEIVLAKALGRAADAVGIDFLGGYSALVAKGMTSFERSFIESIPEALSVTEKMCSSVNVGSSKTGINMDAVRLMGEIVKATAEKTKEADGIGAVRGGKEAHFIRAMDERDHVAAGSQLLRGVRTGDEIVELGVGVRLAHVIGVFGQGVDVPELAAQNLERRGVVERLEALERREHVRRADAHAVVFQQRSVAALRKDLADLRAERLKAL